MKDITKKIIFMVLFINCLIVIVFLLFVYKNGYEQIEFEKEPDYICSSPFSNKLAVITDGNLTVYNQSGKSQKVNIGTKLISAYPLETSIFIITEKGDLYEILYEDKQDVSNMEAILANVKYFTYYEETEEELSSYAAITNSGELYVWGSNENLMLGLGDIEYVEEPTKVDYISHVKKIDFGDKRTLLLTETGEVYQAGESCFDGEEQIPMSTPNFVFTKVEDVSNITDINCSGDVAMIFTDNQIDYWVESEHSYDYLEEDYLAACKEIPFKQFSYGDRYWMGVTKDGNIYFKGIDLMGVVCKSLEIYNEPVEIKNINNVDCIYAGETVAYVKTGNEIIILRKRLWQFGK